VSTQHLSQELQAEFNISPPGGSTCPRCCHGFESHSDLLAHLGLSHHGLLKHFTGYKACGSRIIQKVMETYRISERRSVFGCRKCSHVEFSSQDQAVEHVINSHLPEEIRQAIIGALRQESESKSQICTLCNTEANSFAAGQQHLARHHPQLFDNLPTYDQLILEQDQAVCRDIGSLGVNLYDKDSSHGGSAFNSLHCAKCKKTFVYRSALYQHYATSHFQREIAEKYGVVDNSEHCPLCYIKVTKIKNLLSHLGLIHGGVDTFLEPQFHIARQGQCDRKKILPLTSGQKFLCVKCSKPYDSRSILYFHYAVVHFRERIYAKYGLRDKGHCPLCNKLLHGKSSIIWHFGIAHGFVEACLEPEFHIPGQEWKERKVKGMKQMKKSKQLVVSMENKVASSMDLHHMHAEREQNVDMQAVEDTIIESAQHDDNSHSNDSSEVLAELPAINEASSSPSCSSMADSQRHEGETCQINFGSKCCEQSDENSTKIVEIERGLDTESNGSKTNNAQRNQDKDNMNDICSEGNSLSGESEAPVAENSIPTSTNSDHQINKNDDDLGAIVTADLKGNEGKNNGPAIQIVQVWSMEDELKKSTNLEDPCEDGTPDTGASYSCEDATTSSKSSTIPGTNSKYASSRQTVTEVQRQEMPTGRSLIDQCFSDSSGDENDD
jgi:hypothetical protein